MATIQSQLRINDGMSAVLRQVTAALDTCLASYEQMQAASGQASEADAYLHISEEALPYGPLSMVSDTWNLWTVVTEYLPRMSETLLKRKGKIIIRPDSGDPADILCGTLQHGDTPQEKGLIQLLWDIFGGTVNNKGYRVLDPHIGAIYGDAITHKRATEIFSRLAENGFAASNVVLGFGSYTYQYVTRDTFGFTYDEVRACAQGAPLPTS